MVSQLPYPAGRRRALAARSGVGAALEQELVAERAAALGRLGRRLQDAIDTHRLLVDVGEATSEQVDAALTAVGEAVWSLVVQRECAGFRGDVLGEIRAAYAVPDDAVRRMGVRRAG